MFKRWLSNVKSPAVVVRPIQAKQTWLLRHEILRPGQPFERVQYPEDIRQDALHFGAFLVSDHSPDKLVGVLSLYREKLVLQGNASIEKAFFDKIGWRLRGMAVEPFLQRFNIGTSLLNTCYEDVIKKTPDTCGLWCNARSVVAPFYIKNGFCIEGKEFEMPGIGAHYVMTNPSPKLRNVAIKETAFSAFDEPEALTPQKRL